MAMSTAMIAALARPFVMLENMDKTAPRTFAIVAKWPLLSFAVYCH
jgi:hypothetical protein